MIAYWKEIKEKAGEELAILTGHDVPNTECEVKKLVACALEHGTYAEAAKAVCEASEWMTAHLQIKKHELKASMAGEIRHRCRFYGNGGES